MLIAPASAWADPGVLTGFSWSTAGNVTASSSGSCGGLCGGALPVCYGDATSFQQAGSSMSGEQFFLEAVRSCGGQCENVLGGWGGGSALARSAPVIGAVQSNSTFTEMSFYNYPRIDVGALGVQVECMSGSGAATAEVLDSYSLTFEVQASVRMQFTRLNEVWSVGSGVATTEWTFTGPDGLVLYSKTLSVSGGESDASNGQIDTVLGAGSYVLTIAARASGSVSAGAGSSEEGRAAVAVLCSITLRQCEFPVIVEQPVDANICAVGSAYFSVAADAAGVGLSYQWQVADAAVPGGWRDLTDGPLELEGAVVGALSSSSTSTMSFDTAGQSAAFVEIGLRCRVSGGCGAAVSEAATLRQFVSGSGDGNGDGSVDGMDIAGMISILTGGGMPSASFCAYDMNADGPVTVADVPGLVGRLLGT